MKTSFRRGFSVLETVFSFAVFAVAMTLLMALVGSSLSDRHNADQRGALTAELTDLVNRATLINPSALTSGTFSVPSACPGTPAGPTGISCITPAGTATNVHWAFTPTVSLTGASQLDRLKITASASARDGNIYSRSQTITVGSPLADHTSRTLTVNLTGDTSRVGTLLIVNADNPTTVVASQIVPADTNTVRFAIPDGACTTSDPCRPALRAHTTKFAISDTAALAPEAVIGPASHLTVTDGAANQTTIEVHTRTRASFTYTGGLSPGVSYCLEVRFWHGEPEPFEDNFCAPSGSTQILLDTYEPAGDGIEAAIPVGREIALELATGGPPPSYVGVTLASGDDVNADVEFDGQQLLLSESTGSPAYSPLPDPRNLIISTVDVNQGQTVTVDAAVTADGSPTANATVLFATDLPDASFPAGNSCVTDPNGTCTVTLTAGNLSPSGMHHLFAATSDTTASLQFAALPAAVTVTPSAPTVLTAGTTTDMTVIVRDGDHQPADGATVDVTSPTFTAPTATSNIDGTVTLNVSTPDSEPIGDATVDVTVNGITTPVPVHVVAAPSAFSAPTVNVDPATGIATIIISAADAAARPAAHANINITSDTADLIVATAAETDDLGVATIHAWLPDPGTSGTITLTTLFTSAQIPVTR